MSKQPLAPGWYNDPESPGRQRWWDGSKWTANKAGYSSVTFVLPARADERGPAANAVKNDVTRSVGAASFEQLLVRANTLGHALYWIGPYDDFVYELTETSDREVYIRYLPSGVKVGAASNNYTVIGTYEAPNAYPAFQEMIARGEYESVALDDGGTAAWKPERPDSIYLIYP